MSLQDQVQALMAQLQALQNQLSAQTPPDATLTPPVPPKPPKVATPTPFKGTREDLDRFKAECGLYMAMRSTEFQDEKSQILFVLSYMKGGTAGPWATQKINAILSDASSAPKTFEDFAEELDVMFADPNRQATALQKLALARQGNNSVDELIQEFELHGPPSELGDVGLVDRFEQALNPRLRESIYRLHPMPTTWAEWKQKASILDNQWRHFQASQP